jgi:hypothetical protein
MPVKSGRVVLTYDADYPYKVVLDHDPTGTSEHLVQTVAEGEALIRDRIRSLPEPPYGGPEWHIWADLHHRAGGMTLLSSLPEVDLRKPVRELLSDLLARA